MSKIDKAMEELSVALTDPELGIKDILIIETMTRKAKDKLYSKIMDGGDKDAGK